MKYDAITLDTSIFERHQLNLKGGMLKQLYQFKDGPGKFVLSEIVIREVVRHLALRAERAKDAVSVAIQKAHESELVDDAGHASLKAIDEKIVAPITAARGQITTLMKASGCDIVLADKGDMKRLTTMYFGYDAPFEDNDEKKNEFPDAIALITLEDWAKANKKKLLAISGDKGWARFAEKSEWIDVQTDLAPALQALQDDAENARKIVASLIVEMASGKAPDMLKTIETAVLNGVGELSPYVEASAGYFFDSELLSMAGTSMDFVDLEANDYDFQIVQIGKDVVVARINVNVKAKAEAEFVFQIKDEGEYIPIGDLHAETDVEFEAGALVTLEGDFAAVPPVIELTEVELVDGPKEIDFGDVSPDYGAPEDD